MWNKSKKAISSLKEKLEELKLISDVRQGNNWKAALKDSIELYIGKDSSISKRLDDLHFTRKETKIVPGVIGIFEDHIYDDSKKEDFKHLIENAINHIKANGINKVQAKNNFLSGFNNAEIISGLVAGILIIFGIGNYFGRLEKDREMIEFESKIKDTNAKLNDCQNDNSKLNARNSELELNIKEIKKFHTK